MPENIDVLRQRYLQQAPFRYDPAVKPHFSDEELDAIEKYGYWFEAIWNDQVPLETDKLKHFYLAKSKQIDSRSRLEDLWYRYNDLIVPF